MRLRHYYSCFAMAHKRIQIWQCSRIQALRDCGKIIKEIAIDIGCSERAVQYQLAKVKQTGKYDTRPRSGRPPALNENEERFVAIVSKRQRFKSDRVVRDEVIPDIPKEFSISTVNRVLKKHGLYGRVAVRRSTISRTNKKKRLKFAIEHLNWTKEQ